MRFCLIPMKPLATAKERLAPALDAGERRTLSLAMLADVVEAARGFDRVWVLESDDDAARVAVAGGAEPIPDPAPGRGLNASLDAAT
ncbi:MAG TPA: 2-phospho-L-lactate guanylyltransferase, partial [Actinomycetota bacterium]|nr:2-phospho-L-lactate guanylyltransferase [Actinomycetota bacterium]